MTYPEMTAERHAAKRRHRHAGSLLLGALMIAIPALTALPTAAREKGEQVQLRQAERSPAPARSQAPARKASPPPQRSSSPPARSQTQTRKASPPPQRSSPPPARSATPRRESGSRSGSSGSGTVRPHVVRDSHPGTKGSSSSTETRRRTGSSGNDAWRVGDWRTPTRRTDSSDRRDGWRHDGTYDRTRDEHRSRNTNRSDRRDHRGHHWGNNYHRNHRHHSYCGHVWGGYYDSWGWGHYRHRSYYPWYWPWWPTIYVERDTYSADDGWGALDLDVRPERAEVYLDGQYVGIADEYDGFPSYLWLEKGTYDLAIYLDGYETLFRQVSIYPGIVIDVEDRMRSGESIHPDDYGPTSSIRRDARIERNREKEAAARAAEDEARAREVWSADYPSSSVNDGVGRLFISVLPSDAAVYLDGHFLGTAGEIGQLSAGMVVEPGDHVIELVRPGYETVRRDLVVPPGERTIVEIELDRD